jgi:hypothetical protein
MIGRRLPVLATVLATLTLGVHARAQRPDDALPGEETKDTTVREKLKALTDPDDPTKLKKRETVKPPFEFYRLQVLPFETLPYVKEHHWNTSSLDLKANLADYEGQLQTVGVPLIDSPHAVMFRREARLLKGQQARLPLQVFLPTYAKSIHLDLFRADSIRADAGADANLLPLEPHQMLVPVVGKEAPSYVTWGQKFLAFRHYADSPNVQAVERYRYYRLVVAQTPDRPILSPHPLTWTTISHLIWDGQSPDNLTTAQQQALLDWVHWGGQLIIIGGAGSNLPVLQDSFLGPYLPAEPSGESALLAEADFVPLSKVYRPPVGFINTALDEADDQAFVGPPRPPVLYESPDKIKPLSERPVFLEGLRPREGAVTLPLAEEDPRALAVEWRVGRGRVMIVALRLTDPAFVRWAGLDTLVRRAVLRRPEELTTNGGRRFLSGPELSWVRYLGRDMGAPTPGESTAVRNQNIARGEAESGPLNPVAAWLDASETPLRARAALSDASGISIPETSFVLKVILAYGIALVPINYGVCRFLLRRREWAWVVVPLLALGFAVAVERAAAYDLGFDSACDEIDLLEVQGDYSRAHLSRFAALYSTGRVRYTLSYPSDSSPLSLPMKADAGLRGQELEMSSWVSSPAPQLAGLQVQPRSLSMFRAEQMVGLGGRISLEADEEGRRVINNLTELELRDAALIDVTGRRRYPIGTIAPGSSVAVGDEWQALDKEDREVPTPPDCWANIGGLRDRIDAYEPKGPQEVGELRLVAWTDKAWPGLAIAPSVDRQRGVTLVVVHMRFGPPPSPDGPTYDLAVANPRPAPPGDAPPSRIIQGGSMRVRAAVKKAGSGPAGSPP